MKQGLISHEQFNQMDDQTALSLIFMSGLSTSPTITSVSGQGLGMAIVKEKIEIIGGHLELKSQLNIGTTITITMPLALTTFKGILIKVSDELFALPTSHLKKIIRIRPQEITTIENKESIFVDSTMLAFVKLCDILGLSQKLNSESNQFLQVVVIQSAGNSVAFQVDDIYGEQEILVKKLNKPLIRVNYILGATILENGDLVPILCVSDLVKAAIIKSPTSTQLLDNIEIENSLDKKILVVEDSITTRTLLKNLLEMAGYTVLTAVDGLDAWRVLKSSDISLVVSDIDMPRMNGFDLTQKIRQDTKTSALPVVLVTSKESREDLEYGIDVGANAYILKSHFEDNNFLATIKRLL